MTTEEESGFKFERGANWTPENVRTILQWIHICSINLDVMCESAKHYKILLRRNTILGLVLSTLASTASLSQFNITEENFPGISTALKVLFTVFSVIVAVSTGFIKVYQVQEKLEKSIKLQQEWTAFGSMLSSELQLPLTLRKDALYLIVKYKDTYTELFKQQVDVSRKILARVAKRNGVEPHALSLSELFERVLDTEATRVRMASRHNIYAEPVDVRPTLTPPRSPPRSPRTSPGTPPRSPPRSVTPPRVELDVKQLVVKLGNRLKRPTPAPSMIQMQRENMSKLVMQSRTRK